LTTSVVSCICNWIQTDIFRKRAFYISKELRYDLYLNYFAKCKRVGKDAKINVAESKKHFDMNAINADVELLLEHLAIYRPLQMKRILLSVASLICMFVISWQLTLVTLSGVLAIFITEAFSERLAQQRTQKSTGYKESLYTITQNSFTTLTNEFNMHANEFDNQNEKVFRYDRASAFSYGFSRFTYLTIVCLYRVGLIWYTYGLY
jgi:ABC-type multidrug transport system fused ATPase/permease subunit